MAVDNDRGRAEFSPIPNSKRCMREEAKDAGVSLEAGLASDLVMPKKGCPNTF